MTELENLAMVDFLRKNKVSIDDLPDLVKKLPTLGSKSTEENQANTPTEGEMNNKNEEDFIHDNTRTTI